MKKLKQAFLITVAVLTGLMLIMSLFVGIYSKTAAIVGLILTVGCATAFFVVYINRQNHLKQFIDTVERQTGGKSKLMERLRMPALLIKDDEIIWYNSAFRNDISQGRDIYGCSSDVIITPEQLKCVKNGFVDIAVADRFYRVYGSKAYDGGMILYFVDMTEYENLVKRYNDSLPVVMLVTIDNLEELQRGARDSEKAEIVSAISKKIEDYAAKLDCMYYKLSTDSYLLVTDEYYLSAAISERFDILKEVRSIDFGERGYATLSIGVGHGSESVLECEDIARQALDMALGRGGDQAAVKTDDDYEFFGGASSTSSKRTRVRTRIVASALKELIADTDQVFLVGHRFADLDSFGSCYGMYSAITAMGKEARVVVNRETALCTQLIDYVEENGDEGCVITPEQALSMVTKKTLLIICDTHRRSFLDCPELYDACPITVIIDHHRKTVDYIDNAVIFYHDPYASSACELVSELVQYIQPRIGKVEAEALLSGIMLDTRNFVLHAGSRTFEAAAFLRNCGASTVTVKGFFKSGFNVYKERASIIADAHVYGDCAISRTDSLDKDVRIAASQAADEMLGINGVHASFVLFHSGDIINISARSLGVINVQLIMETLGGGGHLTMAAAQLADCDMDSAVRQLAAAIDKYREEQK
ncbi:MAG: DHH family phosphoesterase [Clostridia bacterium]|nr:DHH family phosphoesterase [Clostridia bacterium]